MQAKRRIYDNVKLSESYRTRKHEEWLIRCAFACALMIIGFPLTCPRCMFMFTYASTCTSTSVLTAHEGSHLEVSYNHGLRVFVKFENTRCPGSYFYQKQPFGNVSLSTRPAHTTGQVTKEYASASEGNFGQRKLFAR